MERRRWSEEAGKLAPVESPPGCASAQFNGVKRRRNGEGKKRGSGEAGKRRVGEREKRGSKNSYSL